MTNVVVSGGFDDLRTHDVRFLEEASKLGTLTVLLWPDKLIQRISGGQPKFPLAERRYFLEAIRYVGKVAVADDGINPDELPRVWQDCIWCDHAPSATDRRQAWCNVAGVNYRIISEETLSGFPVPSPVSTGANRKKVVVTGCYDWIHSGHVRFFEEVSTYGDLTVVVGNDANIRHLKGEGHPLQPEDERRYAVGSIRHVAQALITSGQGWLDADPEIQILKPDIYAVNEDGDKGGKREYCEKNGIEYLVLKRTPAAGLPKRSSTDLRGF